MSIFNVINSESVDPIVEINGIVNLNVIKINGIDNLWPNFTGDDFTGVDDSQPKTRVWLEYLNIGNNASIKNNKLHYDSEGDSSETENAMYVSKFTFASDADFDVQIDWDVVTQTVPTTAHGYSARLLAMNAAGSVVYGDVAEGVDNVSEDAKYVAQGPDGSDSYNTANTSGKFRITRASGVIKVYVWDNARWEWDGSTAGFTTDAVNAEIVSIVLFLTARAISDVESNMDNFVINSGTVVPP